MKFEFDFYEILFSLGYVVFVAFVVFSLEFVVTHLLKGLGVWV